MAFEGMLAVAHLLALKHLEPTLYEPSAFKGQLQASKTHAFEG
jgi:hypothetical protein